MKTVIYPGANRSSQWFATRYPGTVFNTIDKLVIHTTEGPSWPSYGGGSIAPTLTGYPDAASESVLWRQHFPINMSSRALANKLGGVQTNCANVVQIELVGTCAAAGLGMYWPNAPLWALDDLAQFIGWMHTNCGLKLEAAPLWIPYPKSFGQSKARFSNTQWESFRGICGHQHVPENDHGDPGNLDLQKILSLIRPGELMPSAHEIVQELLNYVPESQELNLKTIWKRSYEQSAYNTTLLQALLLRSQTAMSNEELRKLLTSAFMEGVPEKDSLTRDEVEQLFTNFIDSQ